MDLSGFPQGGITPPPTTNVAYYQENFEREVKNDYLALPVVIRKHLKHHHFYLAGGIYAASLLLSEVYGYNRKHEYIPDYVFYGYDLLSVIDNEIDRKKEFIHSFDYGFLVGQDSTIPSQTGC